MQVQAITKNVPMSAQKMREVVRQIQGLPALKAQATLDVTPRKGARAVAQTLKSALANAEHLKNEWQASKLQQTTDNLRSQVENTNNRKRKGALQRRLAKYQSFLDSENHLAAESLRVKEALAYTATAYKRFTPKARGSAGPILKRRCHVKIVLSDE
jgi:large subunit ribosomal protein L22